MTVELKKKLKAGALYYAIFIAFVIALISGFIMMSNYIHRTFLVQYLQGERLDRNIQSALILNNEDPALVKLNESKEIVLFDDDQDLITIWRQSWGAFDLLKLTAKWKNIEKSKIALIGSDLSQGKSIALYLADQQRYLSVSGKSILKGNCYLPELGIRRAYIEGKSFIGEQLVVGVVGKSDSKLPEIDQLRLDAEFDNFKGNVASTDSTFPSGALDVSPLVQHSFFENTNIYYSPEWIVLNNQTIEGNIKIISNKGIRVEESCKLSNIILYAPNVQVMNGFSGSVQIFTTDSLLIGEECLFLSPSAFVLSSSIEKPYIVIGEKTIVKGDIYLSTTISSIKSQAELKLGRDARIEGQVYIDGRIEMQGTIFGSLYCKGFVLRTSGALYENHLLDAVIDFSGLSKHYSGFMLFPGINKTKKLTWLN